MHERLLGRELVTALRHAAAVRGLKRVRHAHIAVSSLRQIDPDALDLCFHAAAPGSVAEGAELSIEQPLAVAYCLPCRTKVVVRRRADACPNCGGHRLHFVTGEELRVLDCDGE
ncbi:MAG: hydrogenase maturation nickel metallochaperone HypA [Alphaproteobacteria bacterium]